MAARDTKGARCGAYRAIIADHSADESFIGGGVSAGLIRKAVSIL